MSAESRSVDILETSLEQNAWLWEIVKQIDACNLPNCWVAAGCIAQTVWNLAADHAADFGIRDVDIVYFDATDLSLETEIARERQLRRSFAQVPCQIDVKNEGRVHLWYEQKFGYSIAPYTSIDDAVASFPTTSTAVGVRCSNGRFECLAPFGLDDLLSLRVRPNKRQITQAIYAAKVDRWRALWPHVTYLPW